MIVVAGVEDAAGPEAPVRATEAPAAMRTISFRLPEGRSAVVSIGWEGGLAIAPPRIDLEPGQRSTGLRIIDFEREGEGWLLTIEGTAGLEYTVDLYGTPVQSEPVEEGASVAPAPAAPDAGGGRFMVAFEAGEGRRTQPFASPRAALTSSTLSTMTACRARCVVTVIPGGRPPRVRMVHDAAR